MLGAWATDAALQEELRNEWSTAKPFPHAVIRNFFAEEAAAKLSEAFPQPTWSEWDVYDNPFEGKLATNKLELCDKAYRAAFDALAMPPALSALQTICGMPELRMDPDLYGAGLHSIPPGGVLGMHLDYSKHPKYDAERAVNAVCFMTPSWAGADEGALELWDSIKQADGSYKMTEKAVGVMPEFNTCVLFRPCDNAFHGVPERAPRTAPPRNTLAAYYTIPWSEGAVVRPKAVFYPHTEDAATKYGPLFEIRKTARIEATDLATHCPEWKSPMVREDFDWSAHTAAAGAAGGAGGGEIPPATE